MSPEEYSNNALFGIIDRFEDDQAVVRLENGQEIFWLKKYLPPQVKEGDVLKIKAVSAPLEAQDRQALAKKILGEILKKNE
jgi:hypothetical protein